MPVQGQEGFQVMQKIPLAITLQAITHSPF